MTKRISINKDSNYRLYDREKGVVGPPHKDSDNVIDLNFSSESIFVEWKNSGVQELNYFDIDLQEFVEHKITWKMLLENNWDNLLAHTHLVHSSTPKFILLTGLPGSGKSTLAKNLSSRTGWLHFDIANFTNQIIGSSPLMLSDYKKVGALAEKKINDAIKDGVTV